jgi:hypothetical protein
MREAKRKLTTEKKDLLLNNLFHFAAQRSVVQTLLVVLRNSSIS